MLFVDEIKSIMSIIKIDPVDLGIQLICLQMDLHSTTIYLLITLIIMFNLFHYNCVIDLQ